MQFGSTGQVAGVSMPDLRHVFRSLTDEGGFHIETLLARLKLDPQQGGELLQELIREGFVDAHQQRTESTQIALYQLTALRHGNKLPGLRMTPPSNANHE
jgi:hypothetical protein